jgi:hypothetical protein
MAAPEIAVPPRTTAQIIAIFMVGAFGGIFPTLLRVAIDLDQKHFKPADVLQFSSLLAMAIFGFLGGGVATIWNERDLKKVFYLGLGLPSFLTVVSSNVHDVKVDAQSSISVPQVEGRKLEILLPPTVAGEARLIFQLGSGKEQGVIRPIPIGIVSIPPAANAFRVETPRADSGMVSIAPIPNRTIKVAFRGEADSWYGLKYAFGVHGKPERLAVKSQEAETSQYPCVSLAVRGRSRCFSGSESQISHLIYA